MDHTIASENKKLRGMRNRTDRVLLGLNFDVT